MLFFKKQTIAKLCLALLPQRPGNAVEVMLSSVAPAWPSDDPSGNASPLFRPPHEPFLTIAALLADFLLHGGAEGLLTGPGCLDPLLVPAKPGRPSVLHHLVFECGEKALRLIFVVANHMAAFGPEAGDEAHCLALLMRHLMEEAPPPAARLAFANWTALLTRAALSERHDAAMRAQVLASLWPALALTNAEATMVHYLSWVCDLVRLSGLDAVRQHVFATVGVWLERFLLLSNQPAVRRAAYALAEAAVLAGATPVVAVWLCPAHQLSRLSPPLPSEEVECPLVSHLLSQLTEMLPRAAQIKKR